MPHRSPVLALCAASLLSPLAFAQKSAVARWQDHITRTQAAQPHWLTPLLTTTPRLEQEVRTDFGRQRSNTGFSTWNLGNGRGPETVLFGATQLTVSPPPFIDHTAPHQRDGFGDIAFTFKTRLLSRNEQHGNAILTAFLGATLPTGKNGNGSCCASITPTLAGGKGWGRFDVVSTAGGSLPVTNAAKLGHNIAWNTTFQYHLGETGLAHFFWPEIESNTNFYVGGPNDGNTQSFLTPALLIGRIPLSRHPRSPGRHPALAFGAGEQIAITHFHTYNHALNLSIRVPF